MEPWVRRVLLVRRVRLGMTVLMVRRVLRVQLVRWVLLVRRVRLAVTVRLVRRVL